MSAGSVSTVATVSPGRDLIGNDNIGTGSTDRGRVYRWVDEVSIDCTGGHCWCRCSCGGRRSTHVDVCVAPGRGALEALNVVRHDELLTRLSKECRCLLP